MLARPRLPNFNYIQATSADDAVAILKKFGAEARLLLGGTDLFNQMRDGKSSPQVLVDIKFLPGMRSIAWDEKMGLTVGAGATMNQIASDPNVQSHYSLLAEAASSVASYQLRSRATIGGNLCNASPCADITPATLVLDSCMIIYGPNGFREITASEFHQGPGKTRLNPCEILTAIKFPPPPFGAIGRYYKLGRNKLGDLSIVSVAVLGYPQDTSQSGFEFRIALGSVGPVVFRAAKAEQYLATHPLDEQTFLSAAKLAREASSPISDVRAGAEYQREMVRNLTLQGLKEVFDELKNDHRKHR